jgi:hypothetical protein
MRGETLEPFALCWGLAFAATTGAHVVLDHLGARPPAGGWALVAAALAAATAGSAAGALLGARLEPPDLPGGGRLLLLSCLAVAVVASLDWPAIPLAPWFDAVSEPLIARARWLPLLALVALPGVAPALTLQPDETLHDARFRRACGYWLSACTPPAAAIVMLVGRGSHPLAWLVALGLPAALLLGALGVRMRLEAFHERGPRLRLALVSITATTVWVTIGTMRGL